MPYGDRSPELVRAWSVDIARHLAGQGCKAIVIACNSASSTAAPAVQAALGSAVPVIDVIAPVVAEVTRRGFQTVGVIGTRATIQSGVYRRAIQAATAPNPMEVREWATPLLAPLIEEGWHGHELMEPVIQAYFQSAGWLDGEGALEALIPGCTHYPLAKDALVSVLGPRVHWIDGPELVASEVKRRLQALDLLNDPEGDAAGPQRDGHRFDVSDLTPSFVASAERFFGTNLNLARNPLWD